MVTRGELQHYEAIGDVGRARSTGKPYSSPDRADLLAQVGAVLTLLPDPPTRVLDCACGAGWLTWLLQRCGYQTTGIDVAERAIGLAADRRSQESAPTFVRGEVERMPFSGCFDAVVYFVSLHHSLDESAALSSALRALRLGGLYITSEPGKGHAASSEQVVGEYRVTERDMLAKHIRQVGLQVGFESARILPRLDSLRTHLYQDPNAPRRLAALRSNPLVTAALADRSMLLRKYDNGIVVLRSPLGKQ